MSVLLRPGSVLYFPAGMWHRVESADYEEPSLSINFSVITYSWGELMTAVVRQLCMADPSFRSPLMLDPGQSVSVLQEQMQSRIQQLASTLGNVRGADICPSGLMVHPDTHRCLPPQNNPVKKTGDRSSSKNISNNVDSENKRGLDGDMKETDEERQSKEHLERLLGRMETDVVEIDLGSWLNPILFELCRTAESKKIVNPVDSLGRGDISINADLLLVDLDTVVTRNVMSVLIPLEQMNTIDAEDSGDEDCDDNFNDDDEDVQYVGTRGERNKWRKMEKYTVRRYTFGIFHVVGTQEFWPLDSRNLLLCYGAHAVLKEISEIDFKKRFTMRRYVNVMLMWWKKVGLHDRMWNYQAHQEKRRGRECLDLKRSSEEKAESNQIGRVDEKEGGGCTAGAKRLITPKDIEIYLVSTLRALIYFGVLKVDDLA